MPLSSMNPLSGSRIYCQLNRPRDCGPLSRSLKRPYRPGCASVSYVIPLPCDDPIRSRSASSPPPWDPIPQPSGNFSTPPVWPRSVPSQPARFRIPADSESSIPCSRALEGQTYPTEVLCTTQISQFDTYDRLLSRSASSINTETDFLNLALVASSSSPSSPQLSPCA